MTRRRFLMASGVVVSGVSLSAQSRGAAADPISGTWTGDMAPQNATSRAAVTMDMTFDGKAISGSVTGPTLTPGVITSGSFDPKTGALKLEVDVTDGGASSRFVFEGTVANGTAAGRVSGANLTGDFKITKK